MSGLWPSSTHSVGISSCLTTMNTQNYCVIPAAGVQAKTLKKYIDGWRGWTVDGFLASWSEDCTQQALPFSSGKPLLTRTNAERLFPHLMSIMTNFEVRPQS